MQPWTLIYIGQGGVSPQCVQTECEDPQAEARKLDLTHPWLQDFQLVAAIKGWPNVRLMDDCRTDERALLPDAEELKP
jgi:hypothetical protein